MSNPNELKPCPFCGEAPNLTSRADAHTSTGDIYFISCFCDRHNSCAHQWGETSEIASERWNRRALQDQKHSGHLISPTSQDNPSSGGVEGGVIDRLVDRFLAWPLPASVCADPIATMPGKAHRVGTHLLTAPEAKAMFEYVLSEMLGPTPGMIEAGAQRLVRRETGDEKWPDSWVALEVRAARNEAERCWRSMWIAAIGHPSTSPKN